MYIRSLALRDFRSWPTLTLDLEPGVTVFVGPNGHGKTNIVEAVGYAAHLGSHRVSQDAPLVRAGAENARISATAINEGRELTAHLLIKPHAANLAQINRTRLKTPRELLGLVKTVLFAPEDLALVRGEPAERRRFLDEILATRQPRLGGVKADYEKVLRQRNALLKNIQRSGAPETLDVWDNQLAALGGQLIDARLRLVDELTDHVSAAYHAIAPESRPARLAYKSSVPLADLAGCTPETLAAALLVQLGEHRQREIDRGMSMVGPHRDDLELFLGDQPAKGFASHGETWSYALALRLGEFELLRGDGTAPILILDDVFAELDAQRRRALVEVAHNAEQVLITTAVAEDLPENLELQTHTVRLVDGESELDAA